MNNDHDAIIELAEMNGLIFLILDPFGHIERISSSVTYKLGIDIAMVRQRRFIGVFTPEYQDVIRSFEKALDTGFSINLPELPVPCMEQVPQSQPKRLSWRIKAVSDGHGHIREIWCIGREESIVSPDQSVMSKKSEDLKKQEWELDKASSAVKALYFEMEQKKLHAERLNRAINRFLARISHELRLPVNTINGFSHLLLDSPLMPLQKIYVNSIDKNAHILQIAIEDILDIAKSETDQLDIEMIEFDLVHLIETTADHVHSKINPENVRLCYRFENNIPMSLRGDPGRIRQILLNLLSNAARYTAEGEICIRVATSGEDRKGTNNRPCGISITVADTGRGISPDRSAAINRLFTQTDDLKHATDDDVGLGLLVTHAIAQRIGGRLSFETEEGRGSAFTVHLELERVDPIADMSIAPVKRKEIENLHVMIVAPDPDIHQIIRGYCEKVPMSVSAQISNIIEAQERFTQGERLPDLLIVSVEMALMNGFEFLTWIRQDSRAAKIPAIAISSNPRPGLARKSQNAGFNAFLAQPVREDDLIMVIQTIFGDRREHGRIITRYLANELCLKGMQVLIADSNPIDRKHTMDILTGFGVVAVTADTLDVVADILTGQTIDAVLIDSRLLSEADTGGSVNPGTLRIGLLDMEELLCENGELRPLRAKEWLSRPVEPYLLREKLVEVRRKIDQRRRVAP